MENAESFWVQTIRMGQISFTSLSIAIGTLLLVALVIVQSLLKRFLAGRLFPRFGFQRGMASAYATICGYCILIIGITVIVPVSFQGINWGTLSVMLGAVSFGIGFGLRNIADNFISGIIILFEQPIKEGDRIELDKYRGTVISIRARSTTVRTNDNIEVIVPNSLIISESVINWSHNDDKVRFRIPIGVHYNSDVFEVRSILEAAVRESPDVLNEPPPVARFMEFGDSSLNFEVRVWTETMIDKPGAFLSDMNFLIWKHLKQAGIEIPYPQRDLYIKEWTGGPQWAADKN